MVEKEDNILKFIWKVENFSYCWHKMGDFLNSPSFFLEIFDGCECCLKLYPRGTDSNENYISIFLERGTSSKGPVKFCIDFEIAFLTANSTLEYVQRKTIPFFRRSLSFGFHKMITRKELLETKKSVLLPDDILTVECRIFTKISNLNTYTKVTGRTYTEIERFRLHWEIEEFRDDGWIRGERVIEFNGIEKSLEIRPYFTKVHDAYIISGILHCDKILKAAHSKIYLLDSNNSVLRVLINDFLDVYAISNNTAPPYSVRFPLIHMRELLENKSVYLPDNKLNLLFELTFCHGFQRSHIEEIAYDTNLMTSPVQDSSLVSQKDSSPEKVPSIENEFHKLYLEETACDFTIKIGSTNLQVHKAVLCARSSVFKAMLMSNMKENGKSMVDISDLELDTVQRMLNFMYADISGDLDWEAAYKLYIAADKYDLMTLKHICKETLKNNLCVEYVVKAIDLINIQVYDDLRKTVLDLICDNELRVMCSTEWKSFLEEKLELAASAMQDIILRKAEIYVIPP